MKNVTHVATRQGALVFFFLKNASFTTQVQILLNANSRPASDKTKKIFIIALKCNVYRSAYNKDQSRSLCGCVCTLLLYVQYVKYMNIVICNNIFLFTLLYFIVQSFKKSLNGAFVKLS